MSGKRRNYRLATPNTPRKYLSIADIQKEYLPISKKRLRSLAKQYLNTKIIGGRLFVERESLERLLADPDRDKLPLA